MPYLRWNMILVTILILGFTAAHAAEEDADIQMLRRQGRAFTKVAQDVKPAVVFIETRQMIRSSRQNIAPFGMLDDEFFNRFFRHRQQQQTPQRSRYITVGQGSGFLVSAEGHIITNNHVIQNADSIIVKLSDDTELEATLVGKDEQSDVAVLKIARDTPFPFVRMGDSDALQVGEWVLAIGSPFGLTQTITAGIVSAKGRNSMGILEYEDFIQTDAAINPGNSGGPLVNLSGEVVGMNTAIFSKSGGYMGIGFTIPIHIVERVYRLILRGGEVTRGYFGANVQALTKELATSFGWKDERGVLVTEVEAKTAAQRAGILAGDIIIAIDGKPVHTPENFRNRIGLIPAGETVPLSVVRHGSVIQKSITLDAEPLDQKLMREIGMTVTDLTPDMARRLGHEGFSGVLVTEMNDTSPFLQMGIRPGALIMQINKQTIATPKDFALAITQAMEARVIIMTIRYRGINRMLTFRF